LGYCALRVSAGSNPDHQEAGGFLGPVSMGWLREATGSFSPGLMVMAGFIALSGLLALLLPKSMLEE
jgi:MFS transporter, ACS family, tartrate transporter